MTNLTNSEEIRARALEAACRLYADKNTAGNAVRPVLDAAKKFERYIGTGKTE